MLLDFRIDELAKKCLEPLVRPFFVRLHQPRISRYIGG